MYSKVNAQLTINEQTRTKGVAKYKRASYISWKTKILVTSVRITLQEYTYFAPTQFPGE